MLAALRIPIDPDRLYTNDDPAYLVWVRELIRRTAALNREAAEQARKRG
jgi:hypothetical protein